MAVPAAGWVVQDHPAITPPSNFNQLRDTTFVDSNVDKSFCELSNQISPNP